MSKRVDEILEFCSENSIEIIAFGLAPNPFGFTYALYGDACSDEANVLDDMLAGLSPAEEDELKKKVF